MLDLIFKNQAMATRDKPQGQFVNDLLRTEFHKYVRSSSRDRTSFSRHYGRKFMQKFIKVGRYSPLHFCLPLMFLLVTYNPPYHLYIPPVVWVL